MGHTYAMVFHSVPMNDDDVNSSKLRLVMIALQCGHLAMINTSLWGLYFNPYNEVCESNPCE